MRWGCDKADAQGLVAVLHASPPGLRLYQSCGFKVVKEYAMDLRPYGVDASEPRRGMVRRPQSGV